MSPAKSSECSLERLPMPGERWIPRRKAALIAAVRAGTITLDDACRRYQLSAEEFAGWLAAFEKHGAPGLRATRFQIYRDPGTRRAGARYPSEKKRGAKKEGATFSSPV
jgi:hypothetical protein